MKPFHLVHGLALALAALLLTLPATLASPQDDAAIDATPFEFAVIGDFPYSVADARSMPRLVAAIRDDPGVEFVVHLGDTHGRGESAGCSDALFRQRLDQMLGIERPVVLTPGDNDWSDCDGSEGSPLERLEAFRTLFFADPHTTTSRERRRLTRSRWASAALA